MRVAHADDVGIDVLQPLGPDLGVFEQIFVERVARRGMDHEEALTAQRESLGHGQLQEITPFVGPSDVPHGRSRYLRQVPKAIRTTDRNSLRHAVIVIAADRIGRMSHRPTDARRGVGPVVDQVSQAKADVEWLGDRREGGPIRMDVGDDQNPHVPGSPCWACAKKSLRECDKKATCYSSDRGAFFWRP